MEVVILETYGEDWESNEFILCKTKEESERQQAEYLRMKNGEVGGVWGAYQIIEPIGHFGELLDYFTINEIKEYFPELEFLIDMFVEECNNVIF